MADENVKNYSSYIKIEIQERNMKAFLELKESETIEITLTIENIFEELSKKGIIFGIKNDLIKEILEEKKWGERFLIAEGVLSVPGEDASFEYYFPTGKSFKPQISEDGRINYHEISIVNSAVKDTILVKKIPAKAGPQGTDVLGNSLPAISGKDNNIQVGSGTYRDPSDSSLIKASVDGIIFYDERKNFLEIQKVFIVKDSVDFSTGNINVKSSVEIKGDVNPGFSVKTPYDIQINGSIEQAIIACDGNLKVNKGIVGDSKNLISAGGDIHAGYINNQNVKCKGSLYVSTEIRNSNIECGGEVIIVKNDGIIMGGKIFATSKLTAPTIGNKYDVPTEIEVGILLELKEKHDHKRAEIAAVYKTISNFNKNIAEISKLPQTEVTEQRIMVLREESDSSLLYAENLKKEIKELEKQGNNTECPTVSVTKTVYPGTVIRIKHCVLEVKEELNHVKFSIENDEIKVTKL